MTSAIRTEWLTKRYGDFEALADLDLTVEPGEVFGFLGPNGSGKTTTIRVLTDEIRPTGGSASIAGLDCRADSVAIRAHLGYLPADLAMYPRLTGRQTLTYFANLRGGVDWSFVDELADRLGADLGKRVGELSTGNRQKVGLIQAFMNRPDVIIMDEPSTGLDPLVQREFQQMMREVAEDGRTVFLSSHTLAEVQRVADRVGIIRAGRLITVEEVATLRARGIRTVELVFDAPVAASVFDRVEGVHDLEVDGERVRLTFDGHMEALLAAGMGTATLLDISTHDADLEEVFLTYYRDQLPDKPSVATGGMAV
ncbi:MAG: ABC-2 type transport system ATP-binding protein [Glaciecola sp.]|jgi:ABC-2 type transport system ATP-binding protein